MTQVAIANRIQAVRSRMSAPPRGAYWQHVVMTKVALLRSELQRTRAGSGSEDWLAKAAELLDEADRAANQPGSRIRLWLGGSAVNRAFVNLHAAQVLIARHASDERVDVLLMWAMSRVRTTMPPNA